MFSRLIINPFQTVEASRLQVGDDASFPVNLVISTLAEGEFLLPALKEYRAQGRKVNVRVFCAYSPVTYQLTRF